MTVTGTGAAEGAAKSEARVIYELHRHGIYR
jgi:hypothetical protein